MTENNTSKAVRYLPQVVVATTAVAVLPVAIVWWLRDRGTVSSPWLGIGLAIVLSLAASLAGSAVWKRCRGSGDVFFSELLLWGWLHRFRGERRLAKAVGRLGLREPGDQVAGEDPYQDLIDHDGDVERQAHLLRQMAAALDAQDPYTDGHSRRVALHCAMVARKMGLSREEVARIRTAAAIHDIGKLRIPLAILNKPSELSAEEFEIVKAHAAAGAEIVSCIEDAEITAMVRHHHERFDGNGYPSGLEGEEIPLGARIVAVADTFDALTSVRPYRKAISHKRALEAIAEAAGTQLDPVAVRAFLRCYSGNRAVLFWTLMAVSPQRALAWVRGKGPGPSNFASVATVATPAALAAVVAAVVGTTGAVASSPPPLRLAQHITQQVSTRAASAKPHAAAAHAHAAYHAATPLSSVKRAVLGVTRTRASRLTNHHSRSGRTLTAGGGGGGGSHVGGSGAPSPPPSHHPTTVVHRPTPSPTTSSAAPVVGAPVSSPGSPPSATTSTPPPGAPGGSGGGGGSTPTGSTGGSGSGGSSGPGGGSGDPPSGSGGSGSGNGGGTGEPLTKDDCKNGGWATYGFTNQGQCVAYVERGSRP